MEPTFAKAVKEELQYLKKAIPEVINDIAQSDFDIEDLISQVLECIDMSEGRLKIELMIEVIKESKLEEDIKEDLYKLDIRN